MRIKNINDRNTEFGNSIVIKTKCPTVLNKLEDLDKFKWQKLQNPKFRYSNLSLTLYPDGFFRGILCDGVEKDATQGIEKINAVYSEKGNPFKNLARNFFQKLASLSKTIEIKNPAKLKELLKHRTIAAMLKSIEK